MFLQSCLPPAAKTKPAPAGPPASASHGWLRLSARIAAPLSPKLLTPTSKASSSSSARFGALAAAPPSHVVNMVNKQQESAEVRGEDGIRAHHVSVWKNKMLPPSVFLTFGTHDIVSVYSQ